MYLIIIVHSLHFCIMLILRCFHNEKSNKTSKDTMNGIAGKPSHDDRLRVILSPDLAGEIAVGTEYIVNVARLFLKQKQLPFRIS